MICFSFFSCFLLSVDFSFANQWIPWVENSPWNVKFDSIYVDKKPIANGDIDILYRAFGYRSAYNGHIVGTYSDEAFLKAYAVVNTDFNTYSSAGTSVVAQRHFILPDAPNGWKVTLKTELNGYLKNDNYRWFGSRPNLASRVIADASISGPGGRTHINYNKNNTDGINTVSFEGDSKSVSMDVPSGGEYSVRAVLESYSYIDKCSTCVGPSAASNFYTTYKGFSVIPSIDERPIVPITATATGSKIPPVKEPPFVEAELIVKNGIFSITAASFDPGHIQSLGDGINELTSWDFNFSSDPEFKFFSSSNPLKTARLNLELTPKDNLFATDAFQIDGLGSIGAGSDADYHSNIFSNLILNETQMVTLNLLDFYSSIDLLSIYKANNGILPASFADDSVVSYARLDLGHNSAPVPEPTSILLVGVWVVGLAGLKRKFRKS